MRSVSTTQGRFWQAKLHEVYDHSFEEFKAYSEIYGIASRLGFESDAETWKQNPTIRGSVNPADLQVVKTRKART